MKIFTYGVKLFVKEINDSGNCKFTVQKKKGTEWQDKVQSSI